RRRRGRLRPVHPCDGRRPGGEGAHVRQAGPPGPQDRPRHRAGRGRGRTRRPGPPGRQLPPLGQGGRRMSDEPGVRLVMGSDSDWPVMKAAAEALDEFEVRYEADVVSAHRMPHEMIEYGSSAERRGLRVIIAGAGGAAHLPGMLASVTPLPVIGVPVPLANLSGLDSLLSIVQMPAGIPVATVADGGARNAGPLAVRIPGAAELPGAAAPPAKRAPP